MLNGYVKWMEMVLVKKKTNPKTFLTVGIHPDHIRGALL